MTENRQRTRIPDRRHLLPLGTEDIEEEPHIQTALLSEMTLTGSSLSNGMIEGSILDGVTFHDAEANGLIIRTSALLRSDLSITSLTGASIASSTLDGCKLTGVRLNRAVLKDVRLTECRADYAQFQHAKLRRVRFERCDLKHAFFNGASLRGTVFEACDVSEADFSNADISGSDLRRSKLDGIRISPEQLKGVVVTHDQALYLAGLLGLVIRDD